jgi:tetratricopeptide (TPR) repeat protein
MSQKGKNLETYSLIWLDSSVNNSSENIQAQHILRTSINHLLTFEDDQLCLQHIDTLSDDDRVIFIVSGRFGSTIVPQITLLRQIVSIYVYCMNQKANEQWTQYYPKVKGVVVHLDELIQRIQSDQTQRQYHRIDESLAINIFKSKISDQGQSSTGLNGQFIYSHLLIDCLIRMDSSSEDKKELIALCKEQYKNNSTELNLIEEFDKSYSSNRAIWWYTRDSFLYRLLNKALRIQNIDLLFLLRFVIGDIGRQLENSKCSTSIRVYRAQQISREEIEILKNSIGEFISINSFLSTSLNRQQARIFHYSNELIDGMEQVFFEIDADPRLETMKAFSQITSLSFFPGEEEVLFMIGSIFRLDQIERDHEGFWNIRMKLCSDNDHQLQTLFQYMKDELGTGETNVLVFGHILRKMGKLDYAEKYYRRFLNQFSYDDTNMAHCYHALGLLADDKGDYESSLIWYKKSLEMFTRTLKSDDPNIAIPHNSIAIIHQRKGDYALALESYEKALSIWKRAFGEDHPHVAICLNNMGNVYRNEKKYSKALECVEKGLTILQKHLPADHSDLASSYGSIGNIHLCLNHHDQALEYYNLALKIYQKSRPPQHPDIAMTLNNIGTVYEDKNEYQQALSYFERAANIYRQSLPATHPSIIQLEQTIKRISSKLK